MPVRFLISIGLLLAAAAGAAAAEAFPPPLERLFESQSIRPVESFEITRGDGEKTEFAAFVGKILVVNVWATWCLPCRDEMPGLQRLNKMLDDDRIVILPIAIDRAGVNPVRRFYEQNEITTLPILAASGRDVVAAFAEERMPYTVLIDRTGKIFARVNGPAKWDDPAFSAYLKAVADNDP